MGPFAAPGGRTGTAFAPPSAGRAAGTSQVRRRPGVLDASRTALIPLRPLSLAEILDASFLVLRSNARIMLLIPLIVIGSVIAASTGGATATALLGDRIGAVWVVVIFVLGGMGTVFLLVTGATWVSSALTRASLQTVLGPGFAPAPPKFDLVGMLKLLPPMIGLIFVQGTVFYLAMGPASVLGLLLTLPLEQLPEGIVPWYSLLVVVMMLLVWCWAMSYFALAVPAYTAESSRTPGWIGKPHRVTNVITVYVRTFKLIGIRNALRACLVMAATVFIGLVVMAIAFLGAVQFFFAFLFAFDSETVWEVLGHPIALWSILGVSLIGSFSVWLAFFATVQTVLYVDLRMRREGLDLAMRFDQVEVPQPSPDPPQLMYAAPPPPPPQPPQQGRGQ